MSEQDALAEYLRLWAYWYSRLRKISRRVIVFATWEEEERAGNEAWDRWDAAFGWLEAHGIRDEHIHYDEATEHCSLLTKSA
jgi:hypothetical protein